jgi:hypothetical protein
MARRPLDLRQNNIALDTNVLHHDGTERDRLVDRFRELSGARVLGLVVADGVREEVQHVHTPGPVKAAIMPQIFNLRPSLNSSQAAERQRVKTILQGNARPGAHAADASHISEAAETGCAFFITEDKRIIAKRGELASVLPPSLFIVTLAEFLEIFDGYEARQLL